MNGDIGNTASALFGSRSQETRTRKTGDVVRLSKLTVWIRLSNGKTVKRHRSKDAVLLY